MNPSANDLVDSPSTVRASSPNYRQPDIVNLEPSFDLHEDDFMTDEQFDEVFGQANPPEYRRRTKSGIESETLRKTIDSFKQNSITYERGKTVELEGGDFLRIAVILEARSKEMILQGTRFRRTSQFRGVFDQHLNEVVMLKEQMEQNPLEAEQPVMENVPLAKAIKLRDLVLTNEAYPIYSFREDGKNIGLSRASARESCRLVCRWKVDMLYRIKGNRKACVQMSVTRLRLSSADRNHRARDSDLRKEWRGPVIQGGSCQTWLPGEMCFDIDERRHGQGIDILGYHQSIPVFGHPETIDLTSGTTSESNKQRYTFGDAFCGAGGASRAAKSAGCRIEWGVDFDPAPMESYRKNFFGTRCEATPVHVFVSYIDENYVVDILHLSPPCKTFSPIHTREGKDDEMNSASFFAVDELLKKTKPRIVTMENTFGLVERWREWLYSCLRCFTSLGFSVRWKVFNLAEYGLPQARRRVIVFASW